MNIFFLGDHFNAGGPNEVNKNLLSVLKDKVKYQKSNNKITKIIERIYKIFVSQCIICSGIYIKSYELQLIKLLNKRLIYLMHGCYFIEIGQRSNLEEDLLKQANLILCVSKTYKEFISKNYYPQYANKMDILTNAINWDEYNYIRPNNMLRNSKRIILIGGGRKLKRNLQVCQAVQELNCKKGFNYHIDVYGYLRENDDSKEIAATPCATFHHVIPHHLLLEEFQKSILFIQNSDFESFSLGVIEAILCGCNTLISKNVGAQDVINNLQKSDIINDPMDIEEIQRKIEFVLENNNNKRLLDSINRSTTTIQYSANKLIGYTKKL